MEIVRGETGTGEGSERGRGDGILLFYYVLFDFIVPHSVLFVALLNIRKYKVNGRTAINYKIKI